jgi:hypothetical protein
LFLASAAAAVAGQEPKGKTKTSAPASTSPQGRSDSISVAQGETENGKGTDDESREARPLDFMGFRRSRSEDGLTHHPLTTTPSQPPPAPEVDDGRAPAPGVDAASESPDEPGEVPEGSAHFHWRAALGQSLLFLAVQHGYAFTQPKTRRDLHGPFFRDYARSVRSLHGWGDGGRFFTNYVAHPMQGSLMGFVQVQNDPAGSRLRLGSSGAYWRSRMKALAWSAAWSVQFEIGPVSQASIGNVGLHGKQTYVDLVMTPTAGLGLLVAEDALDRYVIERIERRTQNKYARIFSRMALNPTRTAANLLRFKKPWHRDEGLR